MRKEELIKHAKQTVEKDGDHSPLFFIMLPSGQIDIVSMMIGDNTDDAAEALKQLVIDKESEEYYSAFSAWMVNSNDISQQMNKVIEDAMQDPTKERVRDAVMKVAELATQRPSKNPARVECLIVCRYTKKDGTEVDIFPYESDGTNFKQWIENDEIEEAFNDNNGSMYTKWNAWNQYQINLDDYVGK